MNGIPLRCQCKRDRSQTRTVRSSEHYKTSAASLTLVGAYIRYIKMIPMIAAGVFATGLGWSPVESWGPTAYATVAAIRKRLMTGGVDSSQRRCPIMSIDLFSS